MSKYITSTVSHAHLQGGYFVLIDNLLLLIYTTCVLKETLSGMRILSL